MDRRVVHDGRRTLQLYFPYDPVLLPEVKALPGRQWNDSERYWAVPDAHVVAVVELVLHKRFDLCDTTRRLYRERGGTLDLDEPVTAAAQVPTAIKRRSDTPVEPKEAAGDFTVSRLNHQVRATLRSAFRSPIWLVGEISGFNKKAHKSTVGFQLIERDRQGGIFAEVAATLFEDRREEIEASLHAAGDPFRLEDEIRVRVYGRVDLYVPWGEYRLVVEALDVDYTLGEAARRRDEIRRQLVAEGILEQNRSLAIPALPLRVGLVTSIDSDAYSDVLQTLKRSGLAFQVTVHGARVQGRQTEPSVLAALSWFRSRSADFDILMVCRGGGSRTDLAWFDSLELARTVATLPIPVVVGIGHEKDTSALDLVGRSERTPTAAAEWLVRQVRDASERFERRLQQILNRAQHALGTASTDMASLARRVPRAGTALIDHGSRRLREATRRLRRGAQRELASASGRLEELATLLEPQASKLLTTETERLEAREKRLILLDPKRVLDRGYAIVRLATGKVLMDPVHAPLGTLVVAELKSGRLRLRSEGSKGE